VKRFLISGALTLVSLAMLYHNRDLTFAVWTLAAIITHRYPLTAVTGIETLIGGATFAFWWAWQWCLFDVLHSRQRGGAAR
jgi:hypothetical protein